MPTPRLDVVLFHHNCVVVPIVDAGSPKPGTGPPNSIRPEEKVLFPIPPLFTPNVPLVIALVSNVDTPPVNIVPFLRNSPVILTSPVTSNLYDGSVEVPAYLHILK